MCQHVFFAVKLPYNHACKNVFISNYPKLFNNLLTKKGKCAGILSLFGSIHGRKEGKTHKKINTGIKKFNTLYRGHA